MSDRTAVYIDNEIDPIARPERQAGAPVTYERVDPKVMRPVFRLSDFVTGRRSESWEKYPCRACGELHECYTHGCRPLAFVAALGQLDCDVTKPATADAVPLSISDACPLRTGSVVDPHRPEDFRWE